MVVGLDILRVSSTATGRWPMKSFSRLSAWRNDPLGFVPCRAFGKDRLARAADEKGPKEGFLGLVEEQVAVELAVGGQELAEGEREDLLGLVGLAEGVGRLPQFGRCAAKGLFDASPGGAVGRGLLDAPEEAIEVLEEARIRCPRGEIQVADDLLYFAAGLGSEAIQIHQHLLRWGERRCHSTAGILEFPKWCFQATAGGGGKAGWLARFPPAKLRTPNYDGKRSDG